MKLESSSVPKISICQHVTCRFIRIAGRLEQKYLDTSRSGEMELF